MTHGVHLKNPGQKLWHTRQLSYPHTGIGQDSLSYPHSSKAPTSSNELCESPEILLYLCLELCITHGDDTETIAHGRMQELGVDSSSPISQAQPRH